VPVCVATVQRRMRIGWNRAADLIAHIKGEDALPAVARMSR
jgi:DNA segregation ATPase FtsK/SpoIIIE-like protein